MLRWCLIAAAVVVVLTGAAVAALPWLLDTRATQAYLAQAATRALGRPVTYTSLSVSAFPLPTIKLKDLQVAEDPAFGPGPFLTVSESRIGIRLRPLFSGRVELAGLTLDEPKIALVEDGRGRWNVATLAALAGPLPGPPRPGASRSGGAGSGAVIFSNVRIVNGSARYAKQGSGEPPLQLEKINGTASQRTPGDAVVLRGDAVAQPGSLRVVLHEAKVIPGGNRPPSELPLDAMVDVDVPDVAALAGVLPALADMSGAAKAKLHLTGTLAQVTVSGVMGPDRLTVSARRARCGEPAVRHLVIDAVRLPLTLSAQRLDSAPATATVAHGAVSLNATATLRAPVTATLKDISAKSVQLGPVLADFLCHPYAVTGPLDLSGEASLPVSDIAGGATGSGRLRIGPGRVVGREVVSALRDVIGLGEAVAALQHPGRGREPSPLDFDSITASYTVANGVARTDDLVYVARDVKVRAAGTYALADGRIAMEVTLSQGANQLKGLVTGLPGSLPVVGTSVKLQDLRDVRKFLDRLLR